MRRNALIILIAALIVLVLFVSLVAQQYYRPSPLGPAPIPQDLEKHSCVHPSEPSGCTANYQPVCGWFNEQIQCIKYPCAQTYGNSCTACLDEKVDFWTDGVCPE